MMLTTAAAWLLLSQPVIAQQGGTANYFYDSNGRLTAVLSPTGEAAIYNYDPAGNFTSITRRAASELSIIDFTPGSASAATPVTIYGTGFNPTPSANTVKFNGVTATVSAATKTRLDVSVQRALRPASSTSPIPTARSTAATSSTSFRGRSISAGGSISARA